MLPNTKHDLPQKH